MARLSSQERVFIEAYCEGPSRLDATESARAAGYADPSRAGRYVLARRSVRRAIDVRIAKRIPGPDEVLGEVSEIAMAPWKEFVTIRLDEDGNEVSVKLDLGAKTRMLELLAKHHGSTASPVERQMAQLLGEELRMLRIMRASKSGRGKGKGIPQKPRRALQAASIQGQTVVLDIEAHPITAEPHVELTKPAEPVSLEKRR